jgi:NAD(P)H-nitrite reductase large subunit
MTQDDPSDKDAKERKIRLLARVVCICKGINLGKVLKGLSGSKTVEDVNRKTGCGSGNCQGQRCGPRIKQLLRKYENMESGDELSNDDVTPDSVE